MSHFLVTLLTALMCLVHGSGCTSGPTLPPKATFQLPQEWKRFNEVEVNDHLWSWDAVIPTPGQEDDPEGTASSVFSLQELNGAKDGERPGATPKEKAQIFSKELQEACLPDRDNCTVDPIHEQKYGGITLYIVSFTFNDRSDPMFTISDGSGTVAFFEKDGTMFMLSVSSKFEAEITQKTLKQVLETLKLEPRS